MNLSPAQELTLQFYEWERRGRGWLLAPHPVELEPPFHPFFGHFVERPYIDDGRRETWLSSLFRRNKEPDIPVYESPALELFASEQDVLLSAFRIVMPKGYKSRLEAFEQFFIHCGHLGHHMAFEVTATASEIQFHIVCPFRLRGFVEGQFLAFFPGCSLVEDMKHVDDIIDLDTPGIPMDYGLEEEFMRPLNQSSGLEQDPLTGLYGVLERLQDGERVVLQILFSGTNNTWDESIRKSVLDVKGGSFFLDAPEMPGLAEQKLARPLFGVCVRSVCQASSHAAALTLSRHVADTLATGTDSGRNRLIPLASEAYDPHKRCMDIRFRESHRFGMLLNVRELAGLAHLPGASVHSKKLHGTNRTTHPAPPETLGHDFVLGMNTYAGKTVAVSLSPGQRATHCHIIGASGTGKTSLLLTCIRQDILAGRGLAVLDPHGDLIDTVVRTVPAERIRDVILIDPSDAEHPVGFNVLSAHSAAEKEILASDLVALFRRFSTSWGDQMNSIFANAVLAFLESSRGGTLTDLRRFLVEKEYRDVFLGTVTDPDIVYFWKKEYPLLRGTSIASILTRLDAFLRPRVIRNMVRQKEGLDMAKVMDWGKILLVKLSHGLMGEENSYLLGAFIISRLQQTAMARQAVGVGERTPFYAYLDEFHHFATPSLATILSGTRKYGLSLTLAHQELSQVSRHGTELTDALLTNAGVRISFRSSDTDARRLAEGFAHFTREDIEALGTGEAIGRVSQSTADFSLDTEPFVHGGEDHTTEIIEHSRAKYGGKTEPAPPDPSPNDPEPPNTPPPASPDIVPKPKPASKPVVPRENRHRACQELVRNAAQALGYRADIELPTPDGTGKVDVSLSKDCIMLAVEISVSTGTAWEMGNIEKCLRSGYAHVFTVSDDERKRTALETMLPAELKDRVTVCAPEDVPHHIADMEKQETSKQSEVHTSKGYRVRVQYAERSAEDAESKRAIIEEIVKRHNRKF